MKFEPEDNSPTRYLYVEDKSTGLRQRAAAVDIIQALRQNPSSRELVLKFLENGKQVVFDFNAKKK